MIKFCAEVREAIPGLSAFDAIEKLYEEGLSPKQPAILAVDVSPVAKIPLKTRVLFQVALRRILELTESFVREVDARAFVAPYVIGRAALETACAAYDVWQQAKIILEKRDKKGLGEFDERTMKGLLGAKSEEWKQALQPESINVLTLIDRISKDKVPNLRGIYDGLSEHAHPNFAGMTEAFSRVDTVKRETLFVESPAKEKPKSLGSAVAAMAMSLKIIVWTVSSSELSMGELVSLCEEEIYDRGTWPKGLPYPGT